MHVQYKCYMYVVTDFTTSRKPVFSIQCSRLNHRSDTYVKLKTVPLQTNISKM